MAKKEATKNIGEGLGISGFTLGVLSILMVGTVGIMISVVGFFFCLVQQRRSPTKLGKVGLILNILGFIFGILLIIVLITKLAPLIEQGYY